MKHPPVPADAITLDVSHLRRPFKGPGSTPTEIVAERMRIVTDDYLELVPENEIVRKRAREWNLGKRNLRRYLKLVKAKVQGERAQAEADQRAMFEGVLLANIRRQIATEHRARLSGDLQCEIASQRTQLLGIERLAAQKGLDEPAVRAQAEEGQWDLARLSDDEARALRELTAKALGAAPRQAALAPAQAIEIESVPREPVLLPEPASEALIDPDDDCDLP